MGGRTGAAAIALLALAGCEGQPDPESGAAQFVVQSPDKESLRFYMGSVVHAELARTGTFVPEGGKRFSMIEVPAVMAAPLLVGSVEAEPITVSLCRAENGILLFHQIPLQQEDGESIAPDGTEVNDPHMTFTSDSLIQTYRSGDEGVYGVAQLQLDAAGGLVAGAAARFRIPFEDEEGYRDGGMLLGIVSQDAVPEDSLLESGGCKAPSP